MRRASAILMSILAASTVSGCVAAAIPVLAAGAVAGTQVAPEPANPDGRLVISDAPPAGEREPIFGPTPALATPGPRPAPAAAPDAAPAAAAGLLPGSAYAAFVEHVNSLSRLVAEGAPVASLVVANGLLVRETSYAPCGGQPPAILIDLDIDAGGTSQPLDAILASSGHAVVDPQMRAAIAAARAAGAQMLWITDSDPGSRAGIRRALQEGGLDPGGSDMILTPEGPDDRKQLRRLRAAQAHCIIAVVGDRRGDAEEAYDYLRDPATPLVIDSNWGEGWFILPAPVRPALSAIAPDQNVRN